MMQAPPDTHTINAYALRLLGITPTAGRTGSTMSAAAAAHGLTWHGLEAFRRKSGQSRATLSNVLDLSERTLTRRADDPAKLERSVAERALRLARIMALATFVLEDAEDGRAWLAAPQPGLQGRTPLAMAASEFGAREVEDLLQRIEHGVYV